jgi:hypothetical protein
MTKMTLTLEQALEIRRTYEQKGYGGAGMKVLAMRYGVSEATIHRILAGTHPLVKGVPNISGQRASLEFQKSTWGEHGPPPPPAPSRIPSRVTGELTRAQAIARPCPTCGARPRESCTRVGGTYPYPMKTVHQERRTPSGG